MINLFLLAPTTYLPPKTMTTLNHSERVHIAGLEINVAYACNLKCEYCSHLGRFMKGIVPQDEILLWYRSWNTKIRPKNIRVLGGEPLLHPHLESILYETRNHWQDSRVELVTNGLLLPKMEPAIFDALKKIGAAVTVSQHFDDPHYNSLFAAGIEMLGKNEIEPHITRSNKYWRKCYRLNEQGHAMPFQSDPAKAWKNCLIKNVCTTLLDNCLYRCSLLGCYSYAVKKGFVPFDGWKNVLDYKPLPPSCTQEELEAFMRGGVCEQCSICPEEFKFADGYEKINPFGLTSTRNLFNGDTSHE